MHEHAIETDGANAKGSLEAALHWDLGTAYDFLLSTVTLMRPKAHGLSAPWAAGVRKRLSPQSQADFKGFFGPVFGLYCYTPLHLVYEMAGPKDVQHFLDFMEAIPGRDFTRRLHAPQPYDPAVAVFLKKMDVGASVSEEEIEEFRKAIARTRI